MSNLMIDELSMTHGELIREQTYEFLNISPNNILLCEGIDDGFYGTIAELSTKFTSQCYELPCSENASVGLAISASAYEVTTILCFQRVEFALLALEQFINNASKNNFLSGGKRPNPSLFRFVIGRGWGQGPSHSQSLETIFAQIPNINVLMPVFPRDSEFIFKNFVDLTAPTISLEHRWTHFSRDLQDTNFRPVSLSPYVVKSGADLTIVATSYNTCIALKAAHILEDAGVSVEVINMFCIAPFEFSVIRDSIIKTQHLIVIDLDHSLYSISSEVLARVILDGVDLKLPPVRMANHGDYSPSSAKLASEYYLNCSDVVQAVTRMMHCSPNESIRLVDEADAFDKKFQSDVPNQDFHGPF